MITFYKPNIINLTYNSKFKLLMAHFPAQNKVYCKAIPVILATQTG